VRRTRLLGVGLAVVLLPFVAASATGAAADLDPSLARLTDAATTTGLIATDTLDPPTALAATGGSSVTLGWTATVDSYAAGYEVRRATVSGGPYALVSTVTPRTAVTTTDAPASSGTYYYVLRSYFQSWTSADSNQASAVVGSAPTSTGYRPCAAGSNAADARGDGNGYETSPNNACAADGALAIDASSGTNTTVSCTDAGKDRHRFWDFNLGVPATAFSIDGIQVRADAGLNNNSGVSQICVELSPDAGLTWTTPKAVSITNTPINTYVLGATNDTWGRTWLGPELADALFRVRITDVSNQATKDFRLDYLAIQVTYTP